MNLLVLSPHRDDAAFSLSLSIARWLSVGYRVTLLNIFTRSLYAPYSDAGSVAEDERLGYVSTMRKKEDESFLRLLPGLTMLDLNLEDAPIRLRCVAGSVCDLEADLSDASVTEIQQAITALLESTPSVHALVLPLALGHHVDHHLARHSALSFTTTLPAAFYEDLPYATREGAAQELAHFRKGFGMNLHPVILQNAHADAVALKLKIASLYVSQIDLKMAETIAGFSLRYGGAERLWVNDLWLSNASELSIDQCDVWTTPLPS